MTARRWALLAAIGIALLLLIGRALAGIYTDFEWYRAMGAAALWREQALTAAALRGASGLLAALFVFANLYAVRQSVVSLVLPRRVANLEIGEEVPGRYMVGAAVVLAIALGALLSLPGSSWPTLALARSGVPFGESDPYFEADLGFFVYWLPFENMLYVWALIAVLVVTAVVVFLYALTPSLRWERGTLYVSNYARRHLVVLGVCMLLVLAWSYRLDAYRVLISGSGPDGAFTFSDHRAAIPVSLWLSILTVGAASVVLFFGWTGQVRVAFVAVTVELLLALGMRELAPPIVRHFADVRDAQAREQPYQQLRADYTRRAYALDRVRRGDSVVFATPAAALDGVPAWDPGALALAVARQQRTGGVVRGIGWSAAPGGLEAVVVEGPGEGIADGDRAGAAAEPWSALRLSGSTADVQGDPVGAGGRGARDASIALPPVLVYDSVPGYAVVSDSSGHVAAPSLEPFLSRLAHAWSLQNFRLLSGDLARPDVRVLTRRGVRDRVRAMAPFFAQGSVITPIVAADSLYWTVDLYATSDYYPFSEHTTLDDEDVSYLRHAGTAVVNAHTGRVTVLLDAVADPIVASWRRQFPSLFGAEALPAAVAVSLPPAVDGAHAQAAVLARYGPRGAAIPRGHLPWNDGADSVLREQAPAYIALPHGALGWTQPVLDSTDRVQGVVVAAGGRAPETYWLPYAGQTLRWNSLLDEVRRAVDSTATVPRDAQLVHGEVRSVPVVGSLLLAQSAFVWRPGVPPSLARVGVARDTVVRTGPSLAAALGIAIAPVDSLATGPADFHARVAALYAAMHDALQRGDWSAFGRAYDALGRLVGRGSRSDLAPPSGHR